MFSQTHDMFTAKKPKSIMKLSNILFPSLSTLIIIVTAKNDNGGDIVAKIHNVQQDDEPRNLQTATGICNFLSNAIFIGLFTCDCNIELSKGNIELECISDYICSPGGFLCGKISEGLEFSGFIPSVSFCIHNATFGRTSLLDKPFCIGPNLTAVSAEAYCPDGLAHCINSGKAATITKPTASVQSCHIQIGPKTCRSCTPCDQSGGVTFDCSNIVKGLKTTTCAKFRIPTGLGSKAKPKLPDIILGK